MSAETGFLRIHYDSNQKPDWFPQVKIELQPTQNNASAAASTKEACTPCEGGRPLDVKRFAASLGPWLMLAATVLFAVSVGTEEWLTTKAQFVNVYDPAIPEGMPQPNAGMVANLRRGLWSVCAQPVMLPGLPQPQQPMAQCLRMDGDCSADFQFNNVFFRFTDTGKGDCSQFRAMRAFALLSVFAAGFAYFAQSSAACDNKKTGLKVVGALLGFSAAGFGMITMALARSHYGVLAFNEYGLAFWLNVISWPLAIFATIAFLVGTTENPKLVNLQTKLQLLAFIFFIVAVTTNEMTYTTTRAPTPGANIDLMNTTQPAFESQITFSQETFGLWETCRWSSVATNGDTVAEICESIDDACDVVDTSDNVVRKVGKCDSFRTIRTFLIISTVASFFTFVLVAAQAFAHAGDSKMVKNFAILSNWLVCGSSFLVIIISVDWFQARTGNYGFSFWLIVLGAAVTDLAMVLQIAVDPKGVSNFRNCIAFSWSFAAFCAMLAAVIMAQWAVVDDVPLYADKWSSTGRTSYGLWRICAKDGTSCVDIATDTTCGVNDGDSADFANCHHFNAVRAFTILATLTAFAFVKLTLRNVMHNKAGADKFVVGFGWATTVFGFIATALATSYYGVTSSEFGLSFWLFVTAWIAIFLVTVYNQGLFFKNEKLAASILITLIVLVFYILTASTSQLIRMDQRASSPAAPMDRLTVHQGFFYRCFKTGVDQRCRFIHRDCKIVNFPYIAENPLRDCAQFNGIRSTGMLALTFQAIGFLAQVAFAHCGGKAYRFLGWFGPAFGSFWGLLSMATALQYYSDAPTPALGHGFWLLTIAWVVGAFGSASFCCSACCGGECCKTGSCAKGGDCKTDCKTSCKDEKAAAHGHSHGAGGHSHGAGDAKRV